MNHENTNEPTQWRLRAVVKACAILEPEYALDGEIIKTKRKGLNYDGSYNYIVDVLICIPDIKEAFFTTLETLKKFMDNVAFLSNAAVGANEFICITPATIKNGESFQIGLPYLQITQVPKVNITKENLNISEDDVLVRTALSHYRKGLLSADPFESLLSLWNSLEILAEEEAKKRNKEIHKLCKKCHSSLCGTCKETIIYSHPATQSIIEEIFQELPHCGDAKKAAKEARGTRGAIAHGTLRDKKLREKAVVNKARILEAAAILISQCANKQLLCDRTHHSDMPLFVAKVNIDDCDPGQRRLKIESIDQEMPMIFSKIPEKYASGGNYHFSFGISLDQAGQIFTIDEIYLPDLGK